jgi:TRAP-type transport system periplasmic protein
VITTFPCPVAVAALRDGRLLIDIFPSEQMGRSSEQYHLARRGDADFAFFQHAIPANRFPLMELTHLPFLFRSAEQASQVLMALLPEYLVAEHRDVKVLYIIAHAPGSIHTRERPVRRPEDLRGLRIRHPSAVQGELLRVWGASPVGMPTGQLSENLQRAVIDGLMFPYDGIGAFRLAGHLGHTTELLSYVTTFAFVMNSAAYQRLPPDLRALIDATSGPERAREVARLWDASEPRGKQYAIDNGVEIIELSEEERAVFREAAEPLIERRLARAETRGLPARAFFARLIELAQRF